MQGQQQQINLREIEQTMHSARALADKSALALDLCAELGQKNQQIDGYQQQINSMGQIIAQRDATIQDLTAQIAKLKLPTE